MIRQVIKIKRFTILLTMFVMLFSTQTFAATKQDLLGAVRSPVTVGDITRSLPEAYVKQFAEMLNRNEYTEEQLDTVLGYINEGKSYWQSTGQPAFSKLTSEQQGRLMGIFNNVAGALDVKVSSEVDSETQVTQNKEGNIVVEEENKTQINVDLVDKSNNKYTMEYGVQGATTNPIKVTGMALDYRPIVVLFSAVAAMLLFSAFYVLTNKERGERY